MPEKIIVRIEYELTYEEALEAFNEGKDEDPDYIANHKSMTFQDFADMAAEFAEEWFAETGQDTAEMLDQDGKPLFDQD